MDSISARVWRAPAVCMISREGVAHGAAEHAGRQPVSRRPARRDEAHDACRRRRGSAPRRRSRCPSGRRSPRWPRCGGRRTSRAPGRRRRRPRRRHRGRVVVVVVDDDHAAQLVHRRLGHQRLDARVCEPRLAQRRAGRARTPRAPRPRAGAGPRGRPRRCRRRGLVGGDLQGVPLPRHPVEDAEERLHDGGVELRPAALAQLDEALLVGQSAGRYTRRDDIAS